MHPHLTCSAEKLEPISCSFSNAVRRPNRTVAPVFYVVLHDAHAVRKPNFRLPTKLRVDLGNVRPGAIWFSWTFGYMNGGWRPELSHEVVDTYRAATANIVDLAYHITVGDGDECVHHITHICEISCLLSVSHH